MDVILLKKERLVMSAVYKLCKDKKDCLVSLDEIMSEIKYKKSVVIKKKPDEAVKSDENSELLAVSTESEPNAVEPAKKAKKLKKAEPVVTEQIKQKDYIDEEPAFKGIIKKEKAIKFSELTELIKQLAALEYFEVTEADSKTEKMYVISLTNKGKGFPLQERDRYVKIGIRIAILVATPIVTTIGGIIIKNILTK